MFIPENRMSGLPVKMDQPEVSSIQTFFQKVQPLNRAANLSNWPRKCWNSSFRGCLLSFLSGALYAICAVIVKYTKNIHPGQLAVYRFIGIFAFSLPQFVKSQESFIVPPQFSFLIALAGIFSASTLFLNFLAYRYLPLGEATVIIFSSPIFITIAGRIFLKERCGIIQLITAITTVIGLILVTKVPNTFSSKSFNYTKEYIYGLVASFLSLIFSTGRFIVTRRLKNVHHAVILIHSSWIAILEVLILTAIVGDFHLHTCRTHQGLLILLLAILSYVSTVFLTVALQFEQAGTVSTVRAASDIILSCLWQTFFFQNALDDFSIVGTTLVGLSITLLGLRKWVSYLPSESAVAKRLKFLSL